MGAFVKKDPLFINAKSLTAFALSWKDFAAFRARVKVFRLAFYLK